MISNVDRRRILSGLGTGLAVAAMSKAAPVKAGGDVFPFVRPSAGALFEGPRKVFAHWHWFPISFDNKPAGEDYYTTELLNPAGLDGRYRGVGGFLRNRPLPRAPRRGDWRLLDMIDDLAFADAIGIDAFQVNLRDLSPGNPFARYMTLLLAAAQASQSRTRVFPSLDCSSKLLDLPVDRLVELLAPSLAHPAAYRSRDSKVWLGAFNAEAWDVERWTALLGALRRKHDLHFFPVFLNAGIVSEEYLKLADTVGTWSEERLDQIGGFAPTAARAKESGAAWCQPVWPQDFRPKDGWYTEAANSLLFRLGWETAIAQSADAVVITTWNDYSEGSAIRPSTAIQFGFYDLAAYFIAWFKTGTPPAIVDDALCYFHRLEAPRAAGVGMQQARKLVLKGSPLPMNRIEVLAWLRAAGDVSIETSERTENQVLPPGLSAMTAPLALGIPRFTLNRAGGRVLSFESRFAVQRTTPFEDFLYRSGSSNRLSASSVAGP